MYRIGEFSKITGLTVKALRYYDEEGIIVPIRNEENNYRCYQEHDFEKVKTVVMLKDLDFSIAEIKDILENFNTKEDMIACLEEKRVHINQEIKRQQALVTKINQKLNDSTVEVVKMNYQFEIKEIEAIKVIAIREKIKWEDTAKNISKLYRAAKTKVNGPMITLYHDGEYNDIADMEICVPVNGEVKNERIEYKNLPKIKALCTTHIGPYQDIKSAYKALYDYARINNYELRGTHREVCVKGPGMIFKGNPNKYVTQIMIPIE